jgi:hypothetical protein
MNDNEFPERTVFRKDVLDKNLSEKDFIQESRHPRPSAFWVWIVLFTGLISIMWGIMNWYETLKGQEIIFKPFLEVTNRDFSVFLWQFPSYMRAHVKNKSGYLPDFQYADRYALDPKAADRFVAAPPDLLFLYHTWSRLLRQEYIPRKISKEEFIEFLNQSEEWDPVYWKNAPDGYKDLVDSIASVDQDDLQELSEERLPLIVRQAFQGWKNYFKEGEQINQLQTTYYQLEQFLKQYPSYGRNFWRNIQEIRGQEVAGADYLDLAIRSGSLFLKGCSF